MDIVSLAYHILSENHVPLDDHDFRRLGSFSVRVRRNQRRVVEVLRLCLVERRKGDAGEYHLMLKTPVHHRTLIVSFSGLVRFTQSGSRRFEKGVSCTMSFSVSRITHAGWVSWDGDGRGGHGHGRDPVHRRVVHLYPFRGPTKTKRKNPDPAREKTSAVEIADGRLGGLEIG